MTKIAILNDYANAALTLADGSSVKDKAEVRVFDYHLSDDEMVSALHPRRGALYRLTRAAISTSSRGF